MFRLRMQTVSWLEAKRNKKGKNSRTKANDLFTFFFRIYICFHLKLLGGWFQRLGLPAVRIHLYLYSLCLQAER